MTGNPFGYPFGDIPPTLEVIAESDDLMPFYAHPGDAGMDLRASKSGVVYTHMDAFGATVVDTGLKVAIPKGYVGFVVPRSSLGARGITVANSPGTVDSGYRGTLKVLLVNHSDQDYYFDASTRIAQLVIVPVATAQIKQVQEFSDADTSRGEGGFGSTGTN